jgi:hypothetical protein
MALMAAVAAMAGSQIMAGMAARKDAKFNAAVYERQAQMTDSQKVVENKQFDRLQRRIMGTTAARVAHAGLDLGGSPITVLIDNLSEVEYDRQITMYNLDVQKFSALSSAQTQKSKGSMAMMSGFSSAFSTMLKGGYDYGLRTGKIDISSGAKLGTGV